MSMDTTGFKLLNSEWIKRGVEGGMRQAEGLYEDNARAEIAAQLRVIWAKAIERTTVDDHRDFYFHGGNHFLAPVMIQCINEAMGLELTVGDLEQARTIAKLTDLIYFERTRIDRSTVVPLRNMHSPLPPLFIVHGVGGNVLGFYSLAKCLETNRPVYGIQAQALLPGREALLGMEQMAAQYVADMRAIWPRGPYHLLGFSFGGLVAYEIAQQLTAAGAEVGFLGMLDTRQPDSMRGNAVSVPLHTRVLTRLRLLYLRTYKRNGRIKYLWRRLGERFERARYMYAASKGGGKVVSAARNVREINHVAGVCYELEPYSGRITLFRALEGPFEAPQPIDLSWGQYAAGGVEIKALPGDHGQILYQPGLGVLAQLVGDALIEAEAPHSADFRFEAGAGRVSMEI